MILRKHHDGKGVDDLDASIKEYETDGFTVWKRFSKPGMKAAMLFKNDQGIELFEFENPGGELERIIRKHEAFVSDDLEHDLQDYLDKDYELAIPISDGTITRRFAYVRDSAGNYIELFEPADDMPEPATSI